MSGQHLAWVVSIVISELCGRLKGDAPFDGLTERICYSLRAASPLGASVAHLRAAPSRRRAFSDEPRGWDALP